MKNLISAIRRILNLDKNKKRLKEKKIFKYNEDDILEILTEYLAEENGFKTFSSKALLLGTAKKDLRAIVVISEFDDDSVSKLNLEEIDDEMDFNGTH